MFGITKRKHIYDNDLMPISSVLMKSKPLPKVEKIMKEAGLLKNVEDLNKYRDQQKQMSDKEGLSKAYKSPDHIYINEEDKKMYVAGSRISNINKNMLLDWPQNFLFIPQGLTKYHNIYKSADKTLRENPDILHIIGHSTGGRVINELGKQYPNLKTTSYNAPEYTSLPSTDKNLRFTTQGDIVNIFDKGGTNIKVDNLNPLYQHSFKNVGDQGSESGRLIM